ncbi:acyl-CoA thioesterase [Pontibacter liquoris]|uniref:acyl-CoA thioesterase n=1 Tax=Pontibacter liquoris TaxID=2905677 RepID=UPI001FA723CC|nr:acyl-CoA thioesterase [Pontibacter liquoris]
MLNPDNLPVYLESDTRVRFEDCDPFGHLNNGRYVDYFLNAREDQLRDNYHLDIYGHTKETGKAWVVASTQIAYLQEAKFNEMVTVRTCLRWFTAFDLLMEGMMLDKATGSVKSVVWMRFVYIDARKGEKATHSPELTTLFGTVAADGEGRPTLYFEERVKEVRKAQVPKV